MQGPHVAQPQVGRELAGGKRSTTVAARAVGAGPHAGYNDIDKRMLKVFAVKIGALVTTIMPVVIACAVIVNMWWKREKHCRRVMAKQEAQQNRLVSQAIDMQQELHFPAVLMRVNDFLSLGKLRPHEEVRSMLDYMDNISTLYQRPEGRVIVFFSHEWTSRKHPDHVMLQ